MSVAIFLNGKLSITKKGKRFSLNGGFSDSKDFIICCSSRQLYRPIGPLLYSFFTNDLPSAMDKARVVMFADDSTMYSAASACKEQTDVKN